MGSTSVEFIHEAGSFPVVRATFIVVGVKTVDPTR